jgi:hypothetical protein
MRRIALALATVAIPSFATLPALAAEKISAGIGGEFIQYFGYAQNDTDTGDFDGFDIYSDGVIEFAGETALDNGITFGVTVGLDSMSDSEDQIDDTFLYSEGGFGRLEIGERDNAAALMHYSAPDVGFGINDSDISDWIVNLSGADADSAFQSTFLYLGEDKATKVTYFSPRFSGFQLGVSYLPEFERNNNAQPSDDLYNNGVAVGVNFVREFGETEVALAAGYLTADKPDGAASGIEDAEGYSFGGNVTYAGFTFGASFASTEGNGGGGTDSDVSFDGDGFDVGASYALGDAQVSLSYFNGEVEDSAAAGNSEHETVMLSGSYEFGPGVTMIGSVFHSEFDADTDADNEGWAALTGFVLEF